MEYQCHRLVRHPPQCLLDVRRQNGVRIDLRVAQEPVGAFELALVECLRKAHGRIIHETRDHLQQSGRTSSVAEGSASILELDGLWVDGGDLHGCNISPNMYVSTLFTRLSCRQARIRHRLMPRNGLHRVRQTAR